MEEFVEIATNFAGREVTGGNVEAIVAGGHGPKQSALNALGSLKIALRASFVFGNLLVEAGIFEGNGEIGGEDGKRLNVLLGEIVELRALEVEHADDLALMQHGNREFRARLRVHKEVALVHGDIGNEYGFTQGCGRTDNAFAGGDAQLSLDALAVLDVETMTK